MPPTKTDGVPLSHMRNIVDVLEGIGNELTGYFTLVEGSTLHLIDEGRAVTAVWRNNEWTVVSG